MLRPTTRWTLALTKKNNVIAHATSAMTQPWAAVTACRYTLAPNRPRPQAKAAMTKQAATTRQP